MAFLPLDGVGGAKGKAGRARRHRGRGEEKSNWSGYKEWSFVRRRTAGESSLKGEEKGNKEEKS